MNATPVIGLEVHVQLLTKTKIFCGCPNRFNPDEPNTQTCPVCLGLPGARPVMNAEAFRLALRTALALNCEIAPFTKWDRKQYYYPDLPKGYQISQYDLPFSHDGFIDVAADGESRRIRIRRAHLEEDAGKNIHDESGRGGESRVDLNRAGTPLLEIVTEPDLTSAREARALLEDLRLQLIDLGVSDCNMQEGSLRCDANVNVRIGSGPDAAATPIVEMKNLNSFSGVEAAIEFEIARQCEEYGRTGRKWGDAGVEKETRGWNADRNESTPQRGKEDAADYRYFPDPDLVPVTVTADQIAEARKGLRESPSARRDRFEKELGLSAYDARVLVDLGREGAEFFETVAGVCGDSKLAANFVTQDVLREAHARHVTVARFPLAAPLLGELLKRVRESAITLKSAREVFEELLRRADESAERSAEKGSGDDEPTAAMIDAMIADRGLALVTDSGAIDSAVAAAIADSPRAIEDYRSGKPQALGAVIGKVLKQVKGADPKVVREFLLKSLSSFE